MKNKMIFYLKNPRNIAISITGIIFLSCVHHNPVKITRAFYYWKTNFQLSNYEQSRLDGIHCKTLYIRFFDIEWNKAISQPKPVAVNSFKQQIQNGVTYIPVVFITQDVLTKLPVTGIEPFVKNFTNLLSEKCVQAKIQPSEIQIDFDWTEGTKEKYFLLLRLFKKQSFLEGRTLSCTIRLHQVRFKKNSGIPPVDKGLLMCYNTGSLKSSGENNSILDDKTALAYLDNLHSYPLQLDIALPLFNWTLLYDNANRFAGILRDVQESELIESHIFELKGKSLYTVRQDTLWNGFYLKQNETIRYEAADISTLYRLSGFIAANKNNSMPFTLIFYHCDSAVLSKYSNDELEKIYQAFH